MSANRKFYGLQSLQKELKVLGGSFAPAGTGAPTTLRGRGFSVVRVGVGNFRVTLDRKYVDLISAISTLQLAAGDDKVVIVGSYDSSAATLDLFLWDVSGAAVVDVAADANNRVNFELNFSMRRGAR